MQVREFQQQQEAQLLMPWAAHSVDTRGRDHPITPCPLRTDYQRDRDRILHCKSFRRLKHKTQMFLAPEGDHYRTRLTHTLEVTQIARTIARSLRLNEDLTEAIGLGHDLGHTPFGHAGERALNQVASMGFAHNLHSQRVVEVLENDQGLNLTWEVRDGIAHHSGEVAPSTLEGQVVHLADRIAYINHDIDDAIRAGILRDDQLPQGALDILGDSHGKRIDTVIRDVVRSSWEKPEIIMSPEVAQAMTDLRQYMFKHIYFDSAAKREEGKAVRMLQEMFAYYLEHPRAMPEDQMDAVARFGVERAVVDYIAGMTDRFAIHTYQELFLPDSWQY
ncbi:MAG: deoxyguanosinetriphosphate triphosphohydrolase [Christensenellales bacterium]